jgi:hypothetical protein
MAVYKIFPDKDATLYSMFPNMNTGLDPIIEATETSFAAFDNPNPQSSRFLIHFDPDEVDNVLENIIGISSSAQLLNNNLWKANLQCFIATATGLEVNPTGTILYCYPVSGAWAMGSGQYLDDPISTNGTSWYWQGYSGSNLWKTNNYSPCSTGSYTGSSALNSVNSYAGGGTWWTGSIQTWFNANTYPISASQTFNYKYDNDANFNVTNIIRAQYTGAISSDGFIVKQDPEFVQNVNYQPELKYFSLDTSTIYPPLLQFSWRDYEWSTGSSTLTILNTLPAQVALNDNPGVFFNQSINVFRVNAAPEYPARVWQTASLYTQNYYLPTASYYAVKDLDTNEFIIPFDTQYTQLSADVSGSYFKLYMNGLQPERYYQVLIQTTIQGTTIVYDSQYYFKVVNG